MIFKELSKKTKSELQKLLQQNRSKLRTLRFNLSSGKVKNVREVRAIKKNIARILTTLSGRTKNKHAKKTT